MVFRTVASLCLAAILISSASAADDLQLRSPAGGETWAADSGHWVMWQGEGSPSKETVRIEVSRDGGASWSAIAADAPDTGRFLWKVPAKTGKAALRVVAKTGAKAESKPFEIISSQDAQYEWKQITMTAAWAPRDGAGALVYKDRMWLLGGWNPAANVRKFFPRICNNEVWSSKDGAEWTLVRANTFGEPTYNPETDWEGRHTAGYVVYKDKMWIVGGDVNQGHYHYDVWNTEDGKTWTHVNKGKPVPWGPRALHYTAVFKDRIWVIGGQTIPPFAPEKEVIYRDCWTSTDGVEWTKIEPKEPCWTPRGMIGGNVVFNGRLWILGGGTYDTPKHPSRNFYNDVWSTADGETWTQHVASAPWSPRQYHDVGVFDGRMWVMEGYHKDSGNRNDVWHSQDGVNWYEVPKTPWKPRHAAGIYTYDGGIWMVGGNNMQPDAWKLVRK